MGKRFLINLMNVGIVVKSHVIVPTFRIGGTLRKSEL